MVLFPQLSLDSRQYFAIFTFISFSFISSIEAPEPILKVEAPGVQYSTAAEFDLWRNDTLDEYVFFRLSFSTYSTPVCSCNNNRSINSSFTLTSYIFKVRILNINFPLGQGFYLLCLTMYRFPLGCHANYTPPFDLDYIPRHYLNLCIKEHDEWGGAHGVGRYLHVVAGENTTLKLPHGRPYYISYVDHSARENSLCQTRT